MRPLRFSALAFALTSLASLVACGDDLSGGGGTAAGTTTTSDGGPNQSEQPPTGTTSLDGGTTTPETPITTDGTCGAGKAPCADGLPCGAAPDCTSGVCTGNICQIPGGNDGVKNGDESDTDCGGTTAGTKRCDVGAACHTHADCTDGCGEVTKKCVLGKSCWKHLGGDTCGATEAATGNCCETAPLVTGSATKIDRYQVTAGRMRGMVERLSGDVRTFVKTLPATYWNQSWNDLVPSTLDEANTILGPYWEGAPNDPDRNQPDGSWSKYSCWSGGVTGHTYKVPNDGSDFTQADLDPKAINCVGWHMANAFCQWEGGRLPTAAEFASAISNGKTTKWPWGNTDPDFGADDASHQDPHGNHGFDYVTPNIPAPKTIRLDDGSVFVRDAAYYMAPPGRYPLGYSATGVADLVGDMIPYVWDVDKNGKPKETAFVWTNSWEQHREWWDTNPPANPVLHVTQWGKDQNPNEQNGYYAIGFRCIHD